MTLAAADRRSGLPEMKAEGVGEIGRKNGNWNSHTLNDSSGRPASVRVLVVDDSAFMRKLISDILNSAPGISVVGTARDGAEAVEKVRTLELDVVTLDVEMPKMDGLEALSQIMEHTPTPCVMLSAHTKVGARVTLEAISSGAFDFVLKPSGTISLDIEKIREELVFKVRAASRVDPHVLRRRRVSPAISREGYGKVRASPAVVAIGASTGGPRAISEILTRLPGSIPAAILIVQHMPLGFTRVFAERLNEESQLKVKEARDGVPISAGEVLVGRAGVHLEVAPDRSGGVVRLTTGPLKRGVRPSADVMMSSAARMYGRKTLGVVLTGMGRDGREGIVAIKKKKGMTIAEDESTCVVFGMPKAAISTGCVDRIVPLGEIPETIVEMVGKM